ncbi:hypothetical protein [Rhodopirellula bahusiensis]|uniref:Uncharacterized protein n=1 Tax=Rhodopirellula bahusiensis TaxID=2014065 RepID=A0A2G1W8G8_9BACT|nr:hypothetical protein [Rhodopirellula bahusiensis]PHQ35120.1 hypothetical protein CEE69_11930 [Rhodopirellula bahusiensis]
MAGRVSKPLPGIANVLGGYISTPSVAPAQEPPEKPKQESAGRAKKSRRQRARLGRPPGVNSTNRAPKEKATLRIDTELMAEYRDWSWDARCQLGELVERALVDYRKRNR